LRREGAITVMLFTRCPDCGTTFRVGDDALTKANGQVRCGRCTRVFNAYDERRDAPSDLASSAESNVRREIPPTRPAASPSAAIATRAPAGRAKGSEIATQSALIPDRHAAGSVQSSSARGPELSRGDQASAARRPPLGAEWAPPAHDAAQARPPVERSVSGRDSRPAASASPSVAAGQGVGLPAVSMQGAEDATALAYDTDELGSMSVAEVVAEVELGTTAYSVPDDVEHQADVADAPMSPSQIERVLEHDELAVWLLEQEQPTRRTAWWGVGSVAAVLVLTLQGVHHFRADLVNTRLVGPMITSGYSLLGVSVTPHWDIRQYEILDWVATAEPNTRGQGSLKITAHIKNRGPQHQPYPSVQLELKDRWESAVGSRLFAPREYLAATPRDLMAPGETMRAEIEVVDPGPDAYGFELDVCIEVETHQLSCGSDKVFL
jgi:predicted Zn finger-like uncharacterized protein